MMRTMPAKDKTLAAFGRDVARCQAERGLFQDELAEEVDLDRAFDRGLMWVDDGLVVHFSGRLRGAARESEATLAWLTSFDGQPLRLPKRFSPDPLLLRRHAEQRAN